MNRAQSSKVPTVAFSLMKLDDDRLMTVFCTVRSNADIPSKLPVYYIRFGKNTPDRRCVCK